MHRKGNIKNLLTGLVKLI